MANETTKSYLWEYKQVLDYVDDWPLMKSPISVTIIFAMYISFVFKIGPHYMKNRNPYNLHTFLVFYNVFQISLSLYMFVRGSELLRPVNYIGLSCNLHEDTTMNQIANVIYIFFMAKLSELTDTVCFILRKKQNQVSFLHVYHHSLMLFATWITLKLEPTYSPLFLGVINSLVHVIMYTYYLLSAYPSLAKYLWWKKYITTVQMVHFFLVFLHSVGNYILADCPPSFPLFAAISINALLFVYLFGVFYIQSYMKKESIINTYKMTSIRRVAMNKKINDTANAKHD